MPTTSWSMLFQGRRAAHTLVLILGVIVSGTNVWIVATVLPSIVADLGGAEFSTWSTVLYTVAAILGTASGRFLMATLGLRRGYLVGALVFLVGSAGCAVAPLETRLALIGSAALWMGLAFRCDARAAHRLFPSKALALTTPVGTGFWIVFLFHATSSQLNAYLPLVLQILHGLSPLGAGYFTVLRGLTWTASALSTAGLQGRRVRLAALLGSLVVTAGVGGQAAVVVEGPLSLLGSFAVLTGIGYGLCYAHLNSWTISAAPPGEEDRTASFIPLGNQLGTAFGAAIAGVVGNAAGLAAGVSVPTVTAAATWVYGVNIVAPVAIALLTLRVLWWHQPVWPPFGPAIPKASIGA